MGSGKGVQEGPRERWRTVLPLVLVFIGPSLGQVHKYAGTEGLLLYILLVFGFWSVASPLREAFRKRISESWADGLAAATGLALWLIFRAFYPVADSGIIGGGSDRDDALNLAVGEILQGRCPYHVRTYLGNPIAPLPGGILLAAPFVALGNSAYQNFFWLLVFFLLGRKILRDAREALFLLWSLLLLSPVVLQQIVTGSDLLANSLAVLLSFWLLIRAPREWKWGPALLLGIGLAWRVNFLLLLPLVFAFLGRQVGWRFALGLMGLVGGAFGLLTLPFVLHDSHGLSLFLVQNKLALLDKTYPQASFVLLLGVGIYAIALAVRGTTEDALVLLRRSALVLAVPIGCGILLLSLQAGRLDLQWADYGVSFLFFGALSYGARLMRREPSRAEGGERTDGRPERLPHV